MSDETETATEREQRLNEVMAAYVEAADAGQAPDRAEILSRHPDLAADLEAFFADHDRLNRLAEVAEELRGQGRQVLVQLGGEGQQIVSLIGQRADDGPDAVWAERLAGT